MFLFLSFIVAIVALFILSDMASSHYYYSEQNFSAAIVLLIYSLVCIIKGIRESTSSFFDDDDYFTNNSRMNSYNQKYNRNYYGDIVDNHNDWLDKYGSRNIETFAPDKKEEKNAERPKVLHYPSNKEIRDKISDLEKSRWWKIKRGFCSFFAIDITKSFYEPTYIEEEVAVKAKKENHSRYMPGNDWIRDRENKEYNEVAKRLSRSCDIAFDGENFVENEDIK